VLLDKDILNCLLFKSIGFVKDRQIREGHILKDGLLGENDKAKGVNPRVVYKKFLYWQI
jgi:hypothetical protein